MCLVAPPREGGSVATRCFIPHVCHEAIGVLAAVTVATACVLEGSVTQGIADVGPGLVKTMSVKPPRGSGRVRLVAIGDIDLQPCGGTHVRNTAEIGPVAVTDIEKKGKQNRRVRIALA